MRHNRWLAGWASLSHYNKGLLWRLACHIVHALLQIGSCSYPSHAHQTLHHGCGNLRQFVAQVLHGDGGGL